MRRREIIEAMEYGTVYVVWKKMLAKVVHVFKHKTWVLTNSGRIISFKHSQLDLSRVDEGPSTITKEMKKLKTDGFSKEELQTLRNRYQL